ncbi:MAG: Na+/H+ antiporter subunit E [Rhodocyclaceae bacterium]
MPRPPAEPDVTTLPMRAFLARGALLAGLWWVLAGEAEGVGIGLAAALLAAWASLRVAPPARHALRIAALPRFVLFFLLQSLHAGWDVARRTLAPGLPLHPGLIRVPLALPAGAPTWWLMLIVSLLPGTLATRLDGRVLELHVLDDLPASPDSDPEPAVVAEVRDAEARIAALFGCAIEPATGGRQDDAADAIRHDTGGT